MGALVCVSEVAYGAVFRHGCGGEGESLRLIIALLQLHAGKIHSPCVHAGRSAGFEAAHIEPQLTQAMSQRHGGGKPVRPGGAHGLTDDGAPVKICARGDDDRCAVVLGTGGGDDGADSAIFKGNVHHLRLLYAQVLLKLKSVLHDLLIAPPVGLRPEGMDSRAFAQIKHTVLDAGFVGCPGHLTAQRVQLPDKVPLARAADGGVAGHIAHTVQIHGEAYGVKPHTRRGKGGLYSGMACAHNGYITFSGLVVYQFILTSSLY